MLRMTGSTAAIVLGLGVAAGGVAALAGTGDSRVGRAATPAAPHAQDAATQKDIVGTAVAAGQFKTLAAALSAAGLVDTLKGDGPFTVFAPTDAAFAKLPPGTVESLLRPENKEKLKAVLTYHVVAGKAMAADLKDGESVKTVNGKDLTPAISGGKVMVGNANVVKADVAASNGVIHVIDAVLMP
jgi:uncharacterized surface protein with fasciclin (FAS1) repeats